MGNVFEGKLQDGAGSYQIFQARPNKIPKFRPVQTSVPKYGSLLCRNRSQSSDCAHSAFLSDPPRLAGR